MAGRGLERVVLSRDEDGTPVLTCLCDCAAVIELTVELDGMQPGDTREFAITCPGCLSPHWITFTHGGTDGG